MSELITNRRSFLGGLLSASVALPALVHAQNIMPVRTPVIWRKPAPVLRSPRRQFFVVGNDFRDFAPGVDNNGFANCTVELREIVHLAPPEEPDDHVEFLRRDEIISSVTRRFPEMVQIAHGMDAYQVYGEMIRPTEVTLTVDLAIALQKLPPGAVVELE